MDKTRRPLLFMILIGVAIVAWSYRLVIEFSYVLLGLLVLSVILEILWAKSLLKANN